VLASSKAPSREENVNTFVPTAFRFRTRDCGPCLVGGQYRENGVSHGLVEPRWRYLNLQSSRNRSPQLAEERRLFRRPEGITSTGPGHADAFDRDNALRLFGDTTAPATEFFRTLPSFVLLE
jgi:hypothetical protein